MKIQDGRKTEQGFGPVEVLVLLLVAAVMGVAVYLYLQDQRRSIDQPVSVPVVPTVEKLGTEVLPTLSQEDTTTVIEQELNAVDLGEGDIEQDFADIQRELQAL